MAEYIEKKKLVNALKMWLMDLENDMNKGDYGELCENKGAREAVESCICEAEEQPAADVQPVNQWISVDDKLPDDCVEVLVYDTDCGIVIGWYDKEKGDFAADFISLLDAVTHWQPLPEPPKED